MNEVWKTINGFERYYLISNKGRVYSNRYNIILKPNKTKCAYYSVCFQVMYERKHFLIHRLVAENFIPNKQNKQYVNHIDGNKHNNIVTNLEWCSNSENQKHAFKLGLQNNVGENHPRSKFKDCDIRKIRKSKLSGVELAGIYNVSPSAISDIRKKRVWNHII